MSLAGGSVQGTGSSGSSVDLNGAIEEVSDNWRGYIIPFY